MWLSLEPPSLLGAKHSVGAHALVASGLRGPCARSTGPPAPACPAPHVHTPRLSGVSWGRGQSRKQLAEVGSDRRPLVGYSAQLPLVRPTAAAVFILE